MQIQDKIFIDIEIFAILTDTWFLWMIQYCIKNILIMNIILVASLRVISYFLLVKFSFLCVRNTFFKNYIGFYIVIEIFIALAEISKDVCGPMLMFTMNIHLSSISTLLLYYYGE